MKQNIIYTVLAIAVALFATSCSQEEFTETGKEGMQALSFAITDGGYVSVDSCDVKPQTRAEESGKATRFTEGDACGLYLVSGSKVVYDNVKLIATTDADGNLTWQTEEGKTLIGRLNDGTYYLYYPYQEDMTGKTASTPAVGMRDDKFFSSLISGWKVKTDQNDYADYTASDLMTAKASVAKEDGNRLKITFKMTHRMAIAVVEMPGTVYKFLNADPEIPDYTALGTATFTGEARPCRMADGAYRYLYNPAGSTTSPVLEIAGSYADGKRMFTFTPSASAGSYKTYKVDGGVGTKEYTMQIGDYLLADGNLLPKDAELTGLTEQVIGIVFHVGKYEDDSSDYTRPLTTGGPTLTDNIVHGYAVALTDVNNNETDCLKWVYGRNLELDLRVGTSTSSDDWNGYSNCQKIHDFVTANSKKGWAMKHFPAALACETYGKRTLDRNGNETDVYDWQKPFAAPSHTSGWFLPSFAQLKSLHTNRFFFRNQIGKVNSFTSDPTLKSHIKSFIEMGDLAKYWSSSERESYSSNAWDVYFYSGDVRSGNKRSTGGVRAVLAF